MNLNEITTVKAYCALVGGVVTAVLQTIPNGAVRAWLTVLSVALTAVAVYQFPNATKPVTDTSASGDTTTPPLTVDPVETTEDGGDVWDGTGEPPATEVDDTDDSGDGVVGDGTEITEADPEVDDPTPPAPLEGDTGHAETVPTATPVDTGDSAPAPVTQAPPTPELTPTPENPAGEEVEDDSDSDVALPDESTDTVVDEAPQVWHTNPETGAVEPGPASA